MLIVGGVFTVAVAQTRCDFCRRWMVRHDKAAMVYRDEKFLGLACTACRIQFEAPKAKEASDQ